MRDKHTALKFSGKKGQTRLRSKTRSALVSPFIPLNFIVYGGGEASWMAVPGTLTIAMGLWVTSLFAHAIMTEAVEADWARQRELRVLGDVVTPNSDAAGGCDGIIDGSWGFHTGFESSPWWQVDLEAVYPVGRIKIYNRCDSGYAARAAYLKILVSSDSVDFQQAYQHDGTVFFGYTDNAPLVVELGGVYTRFIRIQLPGKEYLHLDEVEVYAPDSENNLALGKNATQSSVSQWSQAHTHEGGGGFMSPDALLCRAKALADSLERLGVDVSDSRAGFAKMAARTANLESGEDQGLVLDILWAIRRLSLRNPLLDFDDILFVKRAPTLFPHISDQYYGWFSRGGGGIYILSGFKEENPRLHCLTEDWPEGNFLRPDLSYDGAKVLFAYCRHYPHVKDIRNKTRREELPEDSFYHIFEMNIDGTNVRQLTRGYYNDFDARYLPNGDIIFISTRKGVALQADRDSAAATLNATQPDSYVRCGGDDFRPVPVFTLHRMDGDGGNLRAISAFENFEWTPAIHHDGQILYARWDYIDRFNGDYMSLWATRPDGINGQLVYGNYTSRPQCVFEARPIPGSNRIIFTAAAHHSITGGSLVVLDRTRGTEFDAPIERLTPEVCFPETECWPSSYYAGPWPLSEEHFLVSWSDRPLPPHSMLDEDDTRNPPNALGIYLYDAFGNLNLLHRDPAISSETPIPVKARPKPFTPADLVDWDAPKQGAYLLQDIYQGLGESFRGTIDRLRIVGVLPKVQPYMNSPVLGVSEEDTGKVVLGTVPVEMDGSAYFLAPSGIPLFFQAIDREGMALRTMRSLTYVQPGQTLSCAGCHESRDVAPLMRGPVAARRAPSKIAPDAPGAWPLRYDTLVQPVLERHCVQCHQPEYENQTAAAFNLTHNASYATLLAYADNDIHDLAFEKPFSEVGDCVARQSKLIAFLKNSESHADVALDQEAWARLYVWLDTYAHRQGAFSAEQEQELVRLREQAQWLERE